MDELLQLSTLTTGLFNFLAFIIIISVIVFIHEGGHFLFARYFGVKIDSFSIGFGKEIWGRTDKHGTRWKLSMVPLGGYVQMFGDENEASTPDTEAFKKLTDVEKKQTLAGQPLFARMLIVVGGPLANFILAIVILTGFFFIEGRPEATASVGQVLEGSAADKFGLQEGDVITALNGTNVKRFSDLQGIVSLHGGIEISINYTRAGEALEGNITPKLSESKDVFGNDVKLGLLGIQSGKMNHIEMGFLTSIGNATEETYNMCANTMTALGQMISGERSARELSGIVRITEYSGQAAEKGIRTILWFMAILSINLGLINLFPIPMLDGGHLFFYIIEGLRGKPLNEKAQEACFKVGFVMLICLMIFATFNDILRLAENFNIIS
jgi:regulator of sigma E protease